MAILRHALSRRDLVLLAVGAACMHLFSSLFHPPDLAALTLAPDHVLPPPSAVQKPVDRPPAAAHDALKTIDTADPPLDLASHLPETTVLLHAPGWTIFRNVYMSAGAVVVVTSKPDQIPEPRMMTSTGLEAFNTPENKALREPTDADLEVISPDEAKRRWSGPGKPNRVLTVEGNTMLYNDPPQFLQHYYHFVAELMLGTWVFWSSAFTKPPHSGYHPPSHAIAHFAPAAHDDVPPIHRAIFPHAPEDGWRDAPGFNSYALRAVFPSITVEVQSDWLDRANSTRPETPADAARAWHFPLLLLADRSAAHRGEICGSKTQRTAAEAFEAVRAAGRLRRGWWEPVRRAITRFAGAVEDVPARIPADASALAMPETIVITYIDRQGSRRHLLDADHAALVAALEALVAARGWELNVVRAETLSKDEQVRVIARTTILLGVHGNGLTHLVLMPPTRVSTVIEIFYPQGFAHDYEWTAGALGMKHYGVWNDTFFPMGTVRWPAYVDGFQGTQIPVTASTVVQIIVDRVEGRL